MPSVGLLSRTRYMQYVAVLSAASSTMSITLFTLWSSPSLPKLVSDDSPIGTTLSSSEASWVAALYPLGGIPSGMITGSMISWYGPKYTLLASSIPVFFSWLAIMFARSAVTLYIARFIGGIGSNLTYAVVSIYIGEVAEKDIRGRLGISFTFLRTIATVFVFGVGPFVSYRTLAICCSIVPLAFAIIFWFMPESPYYLAKEDKNDKARKNLIRLRAANIESQKHESQLEEILKTVDHDMQNPTTIWELFRNPAYKKSLIIMSGLKILQQFSGSSAIESYMQTIMQSSKSGISPETSSLILGCIPMPAVLLTASLVDRIGRRPLLIISALGCSVALVAEGFYFYLHDCTDYHHLVDSLSWLPTAGLILFLIMNSLGMNTLPYVLLGEIFPTNIKNHAASVFIGLGSLFAFLAIKFFKPIATAWGMYTMFWIFSVVCVLGAGFVFILLPETKGKTFLEIQKLLNKNQR